MSQNIFEYVMLRVEKTAEIIFIIHSMPSWLKEEIDISYDKDTLNVIVKNETFTSNPLPKIAQDWLKYNPAKIYFANDDGVMISEVIVETTE